MFSPETMFRGQTPEKSSRLLASVFRRYSRCEDVLLSPQEHLEAMKERFCTIFSRSADKPVVLQRVAKKAWAFAELEKQMKTGKPSPDNLDIGLEDKTLVSQVFINVRQGISQTPLNGQPLERALNHV